MSLMQIMGKLNIDNQANGNKIYGNYAKIPPANVSPCTHPILFLTVSTDGKLLKPSSNTLDKELFANLLKYKAIKKFILQLPYEFDRNCLYPLCACVVQTYITRRRA